MVYESLLKSASLVHINNLMEPNGVVRYRHRRSPSSDRFLGVFSPPSSSGVISGGSSVAGDDFSEDDVFWTGDFAEKKKQSADPMKDTTTSNQLFRQGDKFGILAALPEDNGRKPNCPVLNRRNPTIGSPTTPNSSSSRLIPSIPRPVKADREISHSMSLKFQQSAPVNVPMLARRMNTGGELADVDIGEDDEEEEMLPPHEIVARGSSPHTMFSVLEGAGRTLKGRDLRLVRGAGRTLKGRDLRLVRNATVSFRRRLFHHFPNLKTLLRFEDDRDLGSSFSPAIGTMSFARPHHTENNQYPGDFRCSFGRNHPHMYATAFTINRRYGNNNHRRNYYTTHDFSNDSIQQYNMYNYVEPEVLHSHKRRKFSATNWESYGTSYNQPSTYGISPSSSKITSTSYKRDRTRFEENDSEFMSRDEIERFSPSRKDGIDALQETHLRYSYCAFLQNLGLRLELPQTTIGTSMVLCHRFFVRQSHASHDRFLIATAALFLAAKSEETPCPLNNVLRASSEIFHKQDFNVLCYLLPVDWFDQYRERVIEAENVILTTLNFELNVQHPYSHLTSILDKLGLAQSLLVNLALSLVSEGLRSSLWLQFKPHQIAAGAAYLAARSLNMDLTSCQNVWQEFYTPPSVMKDVVQQLMELF